MFGNRENQMPESLSKINEFQDVATDVSVVATAWTSL